MAHERLDKCVTDALTMFWHLMSSVTELTRSNMESTIFVLHSEEVKKLTGISLMHLSYNTVDHR